MSDLMRFSVIYVFVSFSLTAVSCLKVIVRSTGKDALLPCVYKGHNPPPETLSIFWRDKDNSPLLNIKKNKADNSSQHQKFRGRVESFPDLYKDGNFSIILKKVQQLDNGVYECHVPMVDVEQRVQLSVLGERAAAATSPTPGSSAHITAVTLNWLHLLLLSVLLCSVIQTQVTL
ncbi:uncharacterized protein [Channa argus]|uniref:uncharacterized protein isoform X1 n=2 Tax=Channa argus TaxID=215402 RepID=UPI003521D19A